MSERGMGSPEYTPLDFGYEHYVPTAELQARIEQEYPGIVYEHGFYGDKNPVPLEDSVPIGMRRRLSGI